MPYPARQITDAEYLFASQQDFNVRALDLDLVNEAFGIDAVQDGTENDHLRKLGALAIRARMGDDSAYDEIGRLIGGLAIDYLEPEES